jgi:glycosyltransferase involved in cell wall biosynthesis
VSPPISVCVIARDDAAQIRRCLESVAWTDERVVVLDPRSGDASESIARECGARVVRHRYEGNLEQKNFALDQLTHEWVIALDADEALSGTLAVRLRALFGAGDPGVDGIELNRVTWHLGRWIRHGDFHPDWQLRVFRRSKGRWTGVNPHGRVRVAGEVRRVEEDLEHTSYANLADQIDRVREFSRVEAAALFGMGRRTRVLRDLVLRPPARFLRAYLLKAGCLDGLPGFAIASVTAFHVFLKYAMLWELERGGGERNPTGSA